MVIWLSRRKILIGLTLIFLSIMQFLVRGDKFFISATKFLISSSKFGSADQKISNADQKFGSTKRQQRILQKGSRNLELIPEADAIHGLMSEELILKS